MTRLVSGAVVVLAMLLSVVLLVGAVLDALGSGHPGATRPPKHPPT